MQLGKIETQASEVIKRKISTLNNELVGNFRLMLASELPKKEEKSDSAQVNSGNLVSNTEITPSFEPIKVTFTQAFKKGHYYEQVKTLQKVLQNRGLYTGTINGVYDKATIEAVYQFQLKHGILTGKEKKKVGYGRFGAQTRAKMNALLNG